MSKAFDFLKLVNLKRYARISLFVAKWLMRLLSASIEIYLHWNFGRRYVPTLLAALIFATVCVWLVRQPAPPTALFLVGLWSMAFYHTVYAFTRRRLPVAEPHTLCCDLAH
jgi:hypothetical protein